MSEGKAAARSEEERSLFSLETSASEIFGCLEFLTVALRFIVRALSATSEVDVQEHLASSTRPTYGGSQIQPRNVLSQELLT